MKRSMFDTDSLSYYFKGNHPEFNMRARQYLRVFRYFTISAVTLAEAVEGLVEIAAYDRLNSLLREMAEYEILTVGVEEAMLAGRIRGELNRTGQKIGELDPFIAAVAIENNLPLVTNNLRHFERIQALGFPLQLESWRDALP